MALVVTTFTPLPELFSYSGLPDVITERSQFPRGEVAFNIFAGAVDAPGAGDNARISIQMSLPPGYAYVLREAHYSLAASDTEDWEAVAPLTFDNASSGDATWQAPIELFSEAKGTSRRIYTKQSDLKQVVLPGGPTPGITSMLVSITHTNQNDDGLAVTVFATVRFLQFDIEQAHHFEVNQATPVR